MSCESVASGQGTFGEGTQGPQGDVRDKDIGQFQTPVLRLSGWMTSGIDIWAVDP